MSTYKSAVEDMAAFARRFTEAEAEHYIDSSASVIDDFYETHANGFSDAIDALDTDEELEIVRARYNPDELQKLISKHLRQFVIAKLADDADTKHQQDGHDDAEREYEQAVDAWRERTGT